jgi:hypothetical protein
MRQIFIDSKETGVTTIKQAYDYAPWAAKIVKVEYGFIAFESLNAYETWKNQK